MVPISRREFVKTTAKGVAIASIPFFFKANPLMALTTPGGDGSLQSYMDHFGVSETMIREIMSAAMDKGGDYCDLFFQHKMSSYVALEDDAVNRAYTNVDFGVGIRVIKGDQTGYSFTEDVTLKSMKTAARTAANIAQGIASGEIAKLGYHPTPNYYQIKTKWEDVTIEQRIPTIQKINKVMHESDKRVIKTNASISDNSAYILIATSDGRLVCDYQPMVRVSGYCTAEQDGKRESNGYDLCGRSGIEFVSSESLDRIGTGAVRRTVNLFDAVKPEAGEMPVVLAAGSSGILLHEAIGHGMEADFNRKNASIFSDKIGKPVAENFVTIIDDGTNQNVRGSINVDDEGMDSQKTYLVKDGILESYLHDRISAKYYGVKPTGSGRRQSFRFAPIPRMRNTYMDNGPHFVEEIISSVKKGIYVEQFTNGQVNIGAGDYTFYVKAGNLIEDGKLTKPIKDINLIGNGPDSLTKVTMVANDMKMAEGGWTCGKSGQGVPVSMGLPTVLVSSITVGGIS
ncbi:MAG: metallopeptidase TldD-related protein [candidate division Zixibacteria bacterium]|nr:metallopeptidase TldD-related protein [candidate division Zixibacteria bacterium]